MASSSKVNTIRYLLCQPPLIKGNSHGEAKKTSGSLLLQQSAGEGGFVYKDTDEVHTNGTIEFKSGTTKCIELYRQMQ